MFLNSKSYGLVETMRWFGPNDVVSLADIAQAGCSGVVTALHDVPNGQEWSKEAITKRKELIELNGLVWEVVESMPVHEDIKKQTGNYLQAIENYKKTISNLAACGIKIITYNFMPVLDWTRTDLAFNLPNGAKALRFEKAAYIAFDVFILKRKNAEQDYSAFELLLAEQRFKLMTDAEKQMLVKTILAGLPGSEESFSIDDFKLYLKEYEGITATQLREHLIFFLRCILPIAEEAGVKLVIHPDDPPFGIFGLPRIVSTLNDVQKILNAVPSVANNICFCTGSFGVLESNNLPEMIKELASKIYFLHLRSVQRNANGDFFEANHLEGNANMFDVMQAIVKVMQEQGRRIVMRPDHGHQILDDLKKESNPGYTAIGRLKGLAELRGLELGITKYIQQHM